MTGAPRGSDVGNAAESEVVVAAAMVGFGEDGTSGLQDLKIQIGGRQLGRVP